MNKATNRAVSALIAATAFAASQGAFAHTRFQTPTLNEGARAYNAEVIAHGCHNNTTNANTNPIIATSVVFPDGSDSTVTIGGQPAPGTIDDYVSNYGNLFQAVASRDIFLSQAEKTDDRPGGPALGNAVGFHARSGVLDYKLTGLVPFRSDAVVINPASCAKSVTVVTAIADICKVTNKAGFNDEVVNLWTPAVGSDFDGPGLHGYDSPATLKFNRTSPLDASCGGVGVDVTIKPSAAQINRDLPIPGYWPKAR